MHKNFFNQSQNGSIDSFLEDKIKSSVSAEIELLLNQPEFLSLLKEKLHITPPEDVMIGIQSVCSLLNISRTTCHNRCRAGILIPHRTKGSRKVMFSKKQVLSTLKAVTLLKREF